MAGICSLFTPCIYQLRNRDCNRIPNFNAASARVASGPPRHELASFGFGALVTFVPSSSSSSSSSSPGRRKKAVGIYAVAATAQEPEAARRLYVGNIPRTVSNEELSRIFSEHASVEKAEVMYDKYTKRSRRLAFVTMSTVEDANVAIEKLNDTEIGGRKIRVNVTEKPLQTANMSLLQAEDSTFINSPHKVYVGNLAKSVTSELLSQFFSEKGKVLSAKISRVPGTSKSSGFGFLTFSSEEDVEAAIASFNNAVLEGQNIRVNKT